MNYKELFIDKDDVLLIRKELVKVLGDLNEAIILNQLHYWLNINKKAGKNCIDGKYWVYNTYASWQETDFDFWSIDTIKRTFIRLEKKGVVVSANYNISHMDKMKWYTIDYDKLQKIIENAKSANCTVEKCKMPRTISENTNKEYIYNNINNNTHKDNVNVIGNNLSIGKDIHSGYIKDSKVHTFSKEKVGVHTFPPEGEKSEGLLAVSQKLSKDELLSLQDDMIERFNDIVDEYDITEYANSNIKAAFRKYIELYNNKTKKVHQILTSESLRKVFISFESVSGIRYGRVADIDYNYLNDMVTAHFERQHRGHTDYNIAHFAEVDYLNKLAIGIVEW